SAASSMDALTLFQDLTRGVPPHIGRVFREVAYNVHLEEESKGGAGLAGQAAKMAEAEAKKKVGAKGAAALGAAQAALAPGEKPDGLLTAADVEAAFINFTSFGVAPPPPPSQEGAPAPPAQ